MWKLSGRSRIMLNDEKVLIRREALDLGDDTVVVDGKRVKRGYRDFVVRCNVQPVTGKELMQMPEGDRFSESTYLYVWDEGEPLAVNDLVYRPDDGWYQIHSCEGWGSFTKVRMERIDVGPLRSNLGGPTVDQIPESIDLLFR